MNNGRILSWIASLVVIISILLSVFTLLLVINSKDALTKELRATVEQLQKYNFPKEEVKNVTLDEAKLYLAVAKYCEERNNCRGANGRDGQHGVSPACLLLPNQCQGANGQNAYTPVKGVDYFDGLTPECYFSESKCQGKDGVDGQSGTNGADGREVERQCNKELSRMEWRLTGDDLWQPEYNLAPGQTCVTEAL